MYCILPFGLSSIIGSCDSQSISLSKSCERYTRIASILLPQVLSGTQNPEGWDDNYQEQPHSIDDLLNDLKEAKETVLSLVDGLSEEDMNEEIDVWGETHPRKEAVYALLGELLHHNGQIAMLKGIIRRTSR